MPMPIPQQSYDVSTLPVVALGLSYDDDQVDDMLQGPVQAILQDTVGHHELETLLSSVISTDFEQVGLQQLLTDDTVLNNWQVGEAIAEAFVADTDNCHFPWPTRRDLKNPNASPAGCDLTGFQPTHDDRLPYRFAFGEVKTSEQPQSPPSVMKSLGQQLHNLRDDRQTKDALCRYLGHHAIQTDWEPQYKSAAQRYLQSDTEDVAIYGVLVRDVTAQTTDIASQANKLAIDCPAQTAIALYALYLPKNTIVSLSERAEAANAEKVAL